jgi:GT2 family glycosyltransferase/glycosyltransferase involved in cell wall biosynthesis
MRAIIKATFRFVGSHGGKWWGSFTLISKVFNAVRFGGAGGLRDAARIYVLTHCPELLPAVYLPRPTSPKIALQIPEIAPLPVLKSHDASVDIIVCVHNALDDVKHCLESLVRYSSVPYCLILVDDGSDGKTEEYLAHFAFSQGATLIRNKVAQGYTFAANQGMQQSKADYVVLLNSDTVVSPDWLDRMIGCAESDERIGIVGPLSNSASWQSIPEIFNQKGNDWAVNTLPAGINVTDMGRLVSRYSGCLYPRIIFLNGFCLMMKRKLIKELGYFDEMTFGSGYGEENDYCLRASKAGWELALADDVYIYHSQSRSYSDDRRRQLVKQADAVLRAKHGQQIISAGVAVSRVNRVLLGIRARCRVMSVRKQVIERGQLNWEGKRVLFILPLAGPGGGGNVIFQEAVAMSNMGVDVRVLNLSQNQFAFELWYKEAGIPLIHVHDKHHVPELFGKFDAVVATACTSVDWMTPPRPSINVPVRGYYIQDFEPFFFPKQSRLYQTAWNSYTCFSDLVRMTKTLWNRDVVKERIGVECAVVGPSVDMDLFRPRRRQHPDWPERPLQITAMIRPATPRRNARLTMEVLKKSSRIHGGTIEIIIFGCWPEDPDFLALPRDFSFHNAAILNRRQLAFLLNEVDIFVDFSAWQAMGLTAMEAMACGTSVIVPKEGGARTFIRHEENGLLVETCSEEACMETLERLIMDRELRVETQRQAIEDVCQYYPEAAAYNILKTLFPTR